MANGCVMCGKTRFNFGDYDEGVELERTFCSEIRGTRYCKYEELH